MADYKWNPIEDLPDDWTKLASSELAGLASVWREHYETIKDSKALKQFNERLRREWAIETGIIENLYYIDRGVTLTLIEKGIEASLIPHGTTDKPAELIVPILKDQEEVVTGLFDFVGQQRQLSTSYIKQLHQALTQHQRTTAAKDSFGQMIEVELLRGDWKKLPNNPTKSDGSIHEYCPPEQVASEMDQLIAWHQEHLEKQVPPEVEAAWLHHRFTQIHPFQDGNGRMARTLASLIFLREGLFPLVIHRDERDEYIDALEIADQGELQPLLQLFSRMQKRAINQVINVSETILLEGAPVEQIITSAIDRLKVRRYKEYKSPLLANKLRGVAEEKFKSTAKSLRDQLQLIDPNYKVQVDNDPYEPNTKPFDVMMFNGLLSLYAEEIGSPFNLSAYHSWLVLKIQTEENYKMVLSFQGLGNPFLGMILILPFLWDSTARVAHKICEDNFQFANEEPEQFVAERFTPWLDDVIINGLNTWRSKL